jgi:Na+/H+ antiporter NhaD/arsenite permease-like protein
VVFGAVIARQLLGRGPPVWMLFGGGGVATIAVGALSVGEGEHVLAGALPVLVFLLGLFLFASALQDAGALEHLARWLVERAPRPGELPAVLFLGLGLASAFLVNDALVVVGVPVLLAVARRLELPPRPLLLTLAFSVTVGSVLTPFGNPQNLLVALDSGLASPVTVFLRYLLLPTLVSLGLGALYVRRMFRGELEVPTARPPVDAGPRRPLFPPTGWAERLRRHPVLVVFPVTLVTLVTVDVTSAAVHGPPVASWAVAAAGAGVLVAVSPGRARFVRTVNWEILLLFAGLFVVVGGAVQGGLAAAGERILPIPGAADRLAGVATIAATSAVGAQLVSNVPWVALQIPVMASAGYGASTPVAWVALAGASTLAGNLTLLGAASNLIVVDLAEKAGVRIGLRTFVRYGLPLAALTLLVLVGCLAVGL